MIYFIRTANRPFVKIGYCAGDARTRMAGLQVGSVDQLVLLGSSQGEQADEQDWHRRFAYARVRGEWFEFTPDLERAVGLALGHDKPSSVAAKRSMELAQSHLTQQARGKPTR